MAFFVRGSLPQTIFLVQFLKLYAFVVIWSDAFAVFAITCFVVIWNDAFANFSISSH